MENTINQIKAAIAAGEEFRTIEQMFAVKLAVLGVSTIGVVTDSWSVAIEI
jgi:hypothetical protein